MSDDVRPDDATDTTADDSKPDVDVEDSGTTDDADSFPREYVQKLRKESAGYRDKAKTAEERADANARRLFTELVKANGKLADERDIPYDAGLLEDVDLLDEAIEALIAERPHLKARKVTGDVGQGKRDTAETVDLAAMLRARA